MTVNYVVAAGVFLPAQVVNGDPKGMGALNLQQFTDAAGPNLVYHTGVLYDQDTKAAGTWHYPESESSSVTSR